MRFALLAFLLCACGGGGSNGPRDPEVFVHLVADLPDGEYGYSSWGEDSADIFILDWLPEAQRILILKHELWHVLTLDGDHPNDPPCVSSPGAYPALDPCPEEVAQVNAKGRSVRLVFDEDYPAAEEAALWWDQACGRAAVTAQLP